MSHEGEAPANRRGERRVPFDGAVRLRYRLFQEFLEENAANISAGGMFIRTIQPGERGSELDFEVRLDDDFTLIQGRGEVAWVRRRGDEPGAEPGMGIRFLELPPESRALVDKIVRERVRAGLELFDLEGHEPAAAMRPALSVPAAAGAAPIWELDRPGTGAEESRPEEAGPEGAALSSENPAALDPVLPLATVASAPSRLPASPGGRSRSAGASPARSRPTRLIAVAVVSALVGAGAVLTFYWLYVQPSIDALETRIDEIAGRPGGPWLPPADEPEIARGGAVAGADETAAADAAPRLGQDAEVVDALRGWAAAWTEQRTDDYLSLYAAGFEPPDGLGRAAWEAARRARIERPRWIRVALTLVEVEPDGPDAAEVRFVQSYRSERYKDLVRKRMRLVREDGGWKIAAESSLGR